MYFPSNLYHLQLFCDVVKYGGYSQAAIKLNMSQPAISMQMKSLENKLGAVLFVRKGTKLELTDVGVTVHEEAQRVLAMDRQLQEIVTEMSSGKVGHITICSNIPFGRYMLPKYVFRFMQLYPQIKLSLAYKASDDVYEDVLMGTADIGFVSWSNQLDNSNMNKYHVYKDRWSLVCGTNYNWPDNEKTKYDIQEAISETFLISLLPTAAAIKNFAYTTYGDTFLRSGDVDSIKMAIISHLGIAFLPNITVQRELAQGELKEISLKDNYDLSLDYYMIHKNKPNQRPAVEKFIQFILNRDM